MLTRNTTDSSKLTALLIAPDRALADQFTATLSHSRGFQILAEMRTYPSSQTLDIRLRQMRPQVVLLDLTSNRDAASALVAFISECAPPVQVVGLSLRNDSEIVLGSLRLGASEFLCAPFDPEIQQEAVSRLHRLRQPDPTVSGNPGTVIVFSSAKPGSGGSTLAMQTAFSLRHQTGKRVLLADFDLKGGTVGFSCKAGSTGSFLDALNNAGQLSASTWAALLRDIDGVDVLAAPDIPHSGEVDSRELNAVIEFARSRYDWIIIDVPVVFEQISLMVLSNADCAMLVLTPELPTLHLARKALQLLDHIGFPRERFQVLVNRADRRHDISPSDMEKLFQCPVSSTFPNDYFSVGRVVTLGKPLDAACALGLAVQELTSRLTTQPAAVPKPPGDFRPSVN